MWSSYFYFPNACLHHMCLPSFQFQFVYLFETGSHKHRLELTPSFCVCIHVHTRRPEEEVQCSTLSLCFVPLKIGSFTESEAMLVATSPKQSSCLYLHLAAIIDSCKPPIVGPHNCWTIFLAPKFIKYFLVQNENHQKKCMLHYVYLIYSCFWVFGEVSLLYNVFLQEIYFI